MYVESIVISLYYIVCGSSYMTSQAVNEGGKYQPEHLRGVSGCKRIILCLYNTYRLQSIIYKKKEYWEKVRHMGEG